MAGNKNLHGANKAKKDEFYTQLSDIENECRYYKKYFKNKTILCNCDDPYESNFFKYFAMNFNAFGLKKLIATCYVDSPIALTQLFLPFDSKEQKTAVKDNHKKPYKVEITEVKDETGDGRVGLADVEYLLKNNKNVCKLLEGNGDFRSDECVESLKEADIIVTNPPFSLFREYVALLMKYKKKFIIIGNQNAITYKEIFPLIKDNKLWLGPSITSGDRKFNVPDDYDLNAAGCGIDDNGKKFIKVKGVRWFTNLDIEKRHEELILYSRYHGNEKEYPKYDNYDAINVDETKKIPVDYSGVMGVPITFLDKYNPEQFEIVELGNSRENFTPNKDYINPIKHLNNGKTSNGGAINCVLTLATKKEPVGQVYYTSDNSDYLVPPYARILIRRKK